MRNRVLKLSEVEELEFQQLLDNGGLIIVAEENNCSYREAYFILKGKLTPPFDSENNNLMGWL